MSEQSACVDLEARLQEEIGRYVNNPYGFVAYAYPWGEPGTTGDSGG